MCLQDHHRNSTVSGVTVTSDSDPFDYDMSNRAQLPKGIEKIRPHLESMDNVPLLVSLFTGIVFLPNMARFEQYASGGF